MPWASLGSLQGSGDSLLGLIRSALGLETRGPWTSETCSGSLPVATRGTRRLESRGEVHGHISQRFRLGDQVLGQADESGTAHNDALDAVRWARQRGVGELYWSSWLACGQLRRTEFS